MQTARIAIVGAGLSGLYAAYALQQKGVTDYVVLEARDVLGGRIVSAPTTFATGPEQPGTLDRFDLGPSWFWPGYQRQLDRLIQTLKLRRYEQYEIGDMMVERSRDAAPARMRGYVNSPPSMRLEGGMGALVEALFDALDPARVFTGHTVRSMCRTAQGIELSSTDASGQVTTWGVEQVLLAMPPRLVQATVEFSPALPLELARSWAATATWMAPHAKYFALFDTPFWREQGLSGEGRSGVGPLVEIHDASIPQGSAALFGFIGVPATFRKNMPESELRSLCRAQLVRMFGPQTGTPKAEFLKDWAAEPFTATAADLTGASQHAAAPSAMAASGPWSGCLAGIASEWSPQFPGYVAGAVDAADRGVQAVSQSITQGPSARDRS
ncbi:FAD-binding protein [Pseudomonas sp. ICMP22404]|uniref:flavin monoamine oxidase family protein n=1 Tax=Pseudomonas TaxID=286 RepID=UPI0011198577|nr:MULTISPECIES: FAD-dependent oxidoreductase [Pseudomonas]MCI0994960.1 FAD-dependent oxidoreductase [Pseudomonas corrugata]NUT65714.1 NAD(P)-binding protein [Pseudomonas corrugata]TNF84437.1 FAD-binding protein [Pseudomonas sp. ICMP22404]